MTKNILHTGNREMMDYPSFNGYYEYWLGKC